MNNFKRFRKCAGLKQVDAAARLAVAQSTISMWETGESLPRAELLPKIAALYGCTIDDLYGEGSIADAS